MEINLIHQEHPHPLYAVRSALDNDRKIRKGPQHVRQVATNQTSHEPNKMGSKQASLKASQVGPPNSLLPQQPIHVLACNAPCC